MQNSYMCGERQSPMPHWHKAAGEYVRDPLLNPCMHLGAIGGAPGRHACETGQLNTYMNLIWMHATRWDFAAHCSAAALLHSNVCDTMCYWSTVTRCRSTFRLMPNDGCYICSSASEHSHRITVTHQGSLCIYLRRKVRNASWVRWQPHEWVFRFPDIISV